MKSFKALFFLLLIFSVSKGQDPGVNLNSRELHYYFSSLMHENAASFDVPYLKYESVSAFFINSEENFQEFLINIEKFKNLKFLQISHAKMRRLPRELLTFKRLEYIVLFRNMDLNLDSTFLDLKLIGSLRALEISGVDNIRNTICVSDSLTYLMLESNSFKEIPSSIFNLKHLKGLDLRANKITKIPIEIYKMPALEELIISNNKRLRFSEPSFQVEKSAIKRIDLSSCDLKKIPDQLLKIKGIEILDFTWNRIRYLNCSSVDTSSLQVLTLDSNPLEKVDFDFFAPFGNLKFVTFDRCPLKDSDRNILKEKYPKVIFGY